MVEGTPPAEIILAYCSKCKGDKRTVIVATVSRYPGWKKQRQFMLDERVRSAISGVLKGFHA